MARSFDDPRGIPAQRASFPLKTILLGILGFFLLVTVFLGGFNTHAGTVDIVLRMGAPVRVTTPGFNWKIPYIESRHTVELRERAFPMVLEAASRDPMELPVTVTLNWSVNKEHVVQMYNQFGDLATFEERIIKPRLPDAVKGIVSTFLTNELLTKRSELRDKSREAILRVIPQDIMTITGFAVTNVGFPKAYTDQIARVQTAREAANEQEQILRKQNFLAQEAFNTAKAAADAQRTRADAQAYEIEKLAAAEAARILLTGKSTLDNLDRQSKILASSPLLVDYKRAETWKGELPSHFWGGDAAAAALFQMPGNVSKPSTQK